MRTTFVRRTVLTTSAVSLALLVTACGASEKADAKGDAEPSASAPASAASAAPTGKGKTGAAVAGLLLTQGDLPDHTFSDFSLDGPGGRDTGTSDKPECKVLVQLLTSVPLGTPTGAARTSVLAPTRSSATAVTLASYAGKGAEETFSAVKTASRTCAGGYPAGHYGDTLQITKVSSGAYAAAGDEALALTFETDTGGEALPTLVFVRKGDTVAAFSTASDAGTVDQGKPVVDAQVAKLG
ncbi:hypothetical protein ACH4U5_18915 [Streptomyces sp. NPDC020858]|uniref:hypothetical protein n=1 Tax=Streptomyces sp. NPDC020858 TaxID=3365097 RepID=UPI0037981F37